MDPIKLVANDDLPDLIGQLTDTVTGLPLDVSNPTTLIYAKFRAKNTDTVLFTQACTKIGDGSSGQWRLAWPALGLAVDAGKFEMELYLDFNGKTQTVYDLIPFKIRDDF